jgi:outer membrane scaffolding protein for murein synthesis (MipA/OmpV family)
VPQGWSVTIGAAPVVGPAWLGSKDYALSIFPDLRIAYRDVLFGSVPDGLGWNAVRRDGWRAGPLVKLRFGRNDRDGGSPFLVAGGSDALRGLGTIPATAEAGGFVEKQFGPRRGWRARAELRKGLGGGHAGVLADLGLARQGRGSGFSYSVGPRLTLASAAFMRPYFGIDARQASATGLARYRPRGGLLSAGLGGTLVRPLDRRSAVTLFTGVDYLGDPAGRSPLVRERGERLQASLGLGYGFRFGL